MKLAVNYSTPAAELLYQGHIAFDYFKCFAIPDLVTTLQQRHPVYVHFPLKVGLGLGDAVDARINQPADWNQIEALMEQTHTPLINVHLSPLDTDFPDIPADTGDPKHIEMLTEYMIRDVRAVVRRFGADRVVAENVFDGRIQTVLRPAFLPEVISTVIEETGCSLLFDLSHARLSAHYLGCDVYRYIAALPVDRIRELHLTGIHRIEGDLLAILHRSDLDEDTIRRLEGRLFDHLSLQERDWEFFAWALEQISDGAWGTPWAVAFEYGGMDGFWKEFTEADVLREQVPRIQTMIQTP